MYVVAGDVSVLCVSEVDSDDDVVVEVVSCVVWWERLFESSHSSPSKENRMYVCTREVQPQFTCQPDLSRASPSPGSVRCCPNGLDATRGRKQQKQ